MKCANCRYWKRNERTPDETEERMREDHEQHKAFVAKMIADGMVGFGAESDDDLERRIEAAREKDHWGECVRMRGPIWEERQEGTLAVAEDGSSYHSHVKTREDFGCVMFATKERESNE